MEYCDATDCTRDCVRNTQREDCEISERDKIAELSEICPMYKGLKDAN